ncbi:MAG TPA: hypothetical protein VKQ08_10695, partial [Cyclobacteriaceae bacterium]|nr:hypothetical protein [Cyclobacteriaceae bacterium]
KGVMIIGSGNIVHNLRLVDFTGNGKAYDWALEFDEKIKDLIEHQGHSGLINYELLGASAKLAVPTHDHYLPLIYSVALQGRNEGVKFFNEKTDLGSVSMRSFVIS